MIKRRAACLCFLYDFAHFAPLDRVNFFWAIEGQCFSDKATTFSNRDYKSQVKSEEVLISTLKRPPIYEPLAFSTRSSAG